MIHRFVSFYKPNLTPEVVSSQKNVFLKFGIDLVQVPFETEHSTAIENYLNNNHDYDLISIFDVDCIPIKKSFLDQIYFYLTDNMTIYGNAQSSNTLPSNPFKSPPFVAPSFLNFKRELYESSPCKSFSFQWYPTPRGDNVEADVAEVFSRENEKRGVKLIYAYPTQTFGDAIWENDGSYGTKPFKYGNYTEFESNTYHNFQIRESDKQEYFIKYCKRVINEN